MITWLRPRPWVLIWVHDLTLCGGTGLGPKRYGFKVQGMLVRIYTTIWQGLTLRETFGWIASCLPFLGFLGVRFMFLLFPTIRVLVQQSTQVNFLWVSFGPTPPGCISRLVDQSIFTCWGIRKEVPGVTWGVSSTSLQSWCVVRVMMPWGWGLGLGHGNGAPGGEFFQVFFFLAVKTSGGLTSQWKIPLVKFSKTSYLWGKNLQEFIEAPNRLRG